MAIVTTGKTPFITTDIFGSILTLTFSTGETLEVDVMQMSVEMQKQAMLHGMKQKLVDAAAIARNTETGQSASVQDKYDAVREVYMRIVRNLSPSWNKVKSEGTATGNSLLVRALMQMTGKNRNQIDQFLEAKTKEEKAALTSNAKVAAIIATLRAATVDTSIDTDDMLADLM